MINMFVLVQPNVASPPWDGHLLEIICSHLWTAPQQSSGELSPMLHCIRHNTSCLHFIIHCACICIYMHMYSTTGTMAVCVCLVFKGCAGLLR